MQTVVDCLIRNVISLYVLGRQFLVTCLRAKRKSLRLSIGSYSETDTVVCFRYEGTLWVAKDQKRLQVGNESRHPAPSPPPPPPCNIVQNAAPVPIHLVRNVLPCFGFDIFPKVLFSCIVLYSEEFLLTGFSGKTFCRY